METSHVVPVVQVFMETANRVPVVQIFYGDSKRRASGSQVRDRPPVSWLEKWKRSQTFRLKGVESAPTRGADVCVSAVEERKAEERRRDLRMEDRHL